MLEGVFPGPPRELRKTGSQVLRKLKILGADAWQDRGPLTATVFTCSDNVLGVPLQLDESLQAAVPTLPGDWCSIEVRDRDGFLLAIRTSQQLTKDTASQDLGLQLPPPKPYRAIVVDDKGQPIAGALVRHDFGHHARDLSTAIGKTDERGQLAMSIPARNLMYRGDTHACRLLVEAPGRQRVLAWVNFQDDATKAERRIQLPAGAALTGRILNQQGERPRGITLLPDCYAMGSEQHSGVGVPLRSVALDDRGRFSFVSLHPHYEFRLLACMDAQQARAAGMAVRPDVAFAPVSWLAVGRQAGAGAHDLGTLRLDQIPIAQIRVTTDAGVPVPGAHLSLTTEDLYQSPIDYVCDRVGRLQVPLPNGAMRIGAWSWPSRLLRSASRRTKAASSR